MSQGKQINRNTQINCKSFIDSNSFCHNFIKELLVKTFQGVGLQNAKRMAPTNTNLQAMHILKSFIDITLTQRLNLNQELLDQKDPQTTVIDNLSVQQIQSQKTENMKQPPSVIKEASSIKSRIRTKKQVTQGSIGSRKFTQIQQSNLEIKSLNKQTTNFQKLPNVINQFDFSQDTQINKIRNNYLTIQRGNLQKNQQLEKLEQKGLVQRQKSEKVAKQMKKITYDYEGRLFGQGSGSTQPQKLMILNNKFGNAKKTALNPIIKLQRTTIQTEKRKEPKSDRKYIKQALMFRQQAQSIIQNIQKTKGISAGVKIVQQLGQNNSITRQNPLKRSKINSLSQFKNALNQPRFKQYHVPSFNRDKSSKLNFSTINNQESTRSKPNVPGSNTKVGYFNKQFKSRSSYSLNQVNKGKNNSLLSEFQFRDDSAVYENEQRVQTKHKIEYKGLPFIKTKGYKAIQFSSQRSFKLIKDQNNQTLRQKLRNKIHINDVGLLRSTLEDL